MPPLPSDADKAWNDMLGKPTGSAKPAAPAPTSQPSPTPAAPPSGASTPSLPLAAAAKWGAILILGIVAIVAVAWVVLSNRTRPAIVQAPPPATSGDTATPTSPTPPTPPAQTGGSLLDINTVTAAQLEHLPGIGPALAARIVADRTRHGKYTSVDQLDRVEGIGPKTLDKLRPYLTVK